MGNLVFMKVSLILHMTRLLTRNYFQQLNTVTKQWFQSKGRAPPGGCVNINILLNCASCGETALKTTVFRNNFGALGSTTIGGAAEEFHEPLS